MYAYNSQYLSRLYDRLGKKVEGRMLATSFVDTD